MKKKKRKDLVDIFKETDARPEEGLQIIFSEDDNFNLTEILREIKNEDSEQRNLVS